MEGSPSIVGFDGLVDGEKRSLSGSNPLVGILAAVLGNLIISIALNVQRYAHLRLNDQARLPVTMASGPPLEAATSSFASATGAASSSSMTYLRSRLWWLGVLLMTIGETGNFMAYGFAPASVVSPLGVLALVSNCIVAPIFFHVSISPQNIAGVAVTILGILLIVFSVQTGNDKSVPFWRSLASRIFETALSPHEFIMYSISQTVFKVYVFVVVMLMGLLWLQTTYIDPDSTQVHNLFANLGLVALFGAFTALSTKGLSSLLSYSFSHALADPLAYLLLAILVLTAVAQVLYLNRALRLFDSTMVLPVHFVLFTISVIVGSAIMYRDFQHTDSGHLAFFFVGCLLTFCGVWIITSSAAKPLDPLPETQPLLVEPELLIPTRGHQKRPSYTSLSSTSNSLLPFRKSGHSYSNSLPNFSSTASSPLLVPSTSTNASAVSFFKPYTTDVPTTNAAGSSCVQPIHDYLGIAHDSPTNSPVTWTSSGFFIGTVMQARRSLELLGVFTNSPPTATEPRRREPRPRA